MAIDLSTLTHLIAVPGSRSTIDFVHPVSGLTLSYGHTLAQVQEREPLAVLMSYEDFQTAQVAAQNTPVEWMPTTEADYYEMLNCLPPAAWVGR